MSFNYDDLVVSIPDFPKPGVVFKDITPVFANAEAFASVIDEIAEHYAGKGVTKILAAEARGFMVGSALAYRMNAGFVPARKPGKLPRETIREEFILEYGADSLEIHSDALVPGDRVLIIDDLIATGGTAQAMVKLIERADAEVVGFGFFMELAFLKPREALAKVTDADVFSLFVVE
ncbi:MAG: adenine phosphoribosyltransferase [Eggerthellaceae bacterium]|nr:adenine phosphoribosyltransferase [Eggerthellaceae bacterium]